MAGAYPGFSSKKQLGVLPLPPDGMLVHPRDMPSS